MLIYILRRIASAVSVVIVTLVASFGLFFVAPTDPAGTICGQRCTPERHADISASLNLDQPVAQQFAEYLKGLAVGRTYHSGGLTSSATRPASATRTRSASRSPS